MYWINRTQCEKAISVKVLRFEEYVKLKAFFKFERVLGTVAAVLHGTYTMYIIHAIDYSRKFASATVWQIGKHEDGLRFYAFVLDFFFLITCEYIVCFRVIISVCIVVLARDFSIVVETFHNENGTKTNTCNYILIYLSSPRFIAPRVFIGST